MPSNNATPLYHRIEARLRGDIASGRIGEGDRMPSEAELAREFGTTRGTVRQALQRLTFEGLIVREVGRGTFAASPNPESRVVTHFATSFEGHMAARGATVEFALVSFAGCPAPEGIAHALRLSPGERAYRMIRRRLIDGEIVGYEDRWLVADVGRRVKQAQLRSQSAIAMVETTLGEPLGDLEVIVRACAANAESAKLLGVKRGSALLMRAHTFLDRQRRPVLTGQSVYRGDRWEFSYVLESSPAGAQTSAVP